MVRNSLIGILQNITERLAREWCKEIKVSEEMATYAKLDEKKLLQRNRKVFDQLFLWMDNKTSRTEIGEFFVSVGKTRYKEGFPLCEVIYALYLSKKIFWKTINSEGILTTSLALYQAFELTNEICSFFDLGSFYLIRGYMEEMYGAIGKSGKVSKEDLKTYFFPGSFYNDSINFDEVFSRFPFTDWKW